MPEESDSGAGGSGRGCLFAIHPIQAGELRLRSNLLGALLCFASLLDWPAGRQWVAVAWFTAALLAKEECAAFPVMVWISKEQHAQAWRPTLQIQLARALPAATSLPHKIP